MLIRPAAPADEQDLTAIIASAGLTGHPASIRFALHHPDVMAFVAVQDGQAVGTGAVTVYGGRSGWIGMVAVRPDQQRQGIGRALMEYAEDTLLAKGVGSIVLSASPYGRPLYEKMGYEAGAGYVAYAGVGTAQPPVGEPAGQRVRRLAEADWPSVAELDFGATGERRTGIMRALPPGYGVQGADGRLAGFVVPTPWGTGPAVASDPAVGRLLLDQMRYLGGPGSMRILTTDTNHEAVACLEALGFTLARRNTYMFKGARPQPYRPERIWGMFSFAMG